MKHSIAALVLVVLVAVAVRAHLGIQIIDDAFITFRYSQNLASGEGFLYNPPERILGTSTPLFAMVMAGVAAVGLDLPTAAFVIALVADLASVVLVALILRGLGFPIAALLTALAFAVAPSVVLYSVSGMETSLYVALVLLAFRAVQRERWHLAAVTTGLACFCRPDGVVLAAAVCGGALLTLPLRRALTVGAIIGAIMVPWVVFATLYFGSPIPGSIFAKADMATDPLAGFRVFKGFFLTFPTLIPSVLAMAGGVLLWRTRSLTVRLWLAWGAVYTLIFAVSRAFDGYTWYFTPLMPLYFAAGAVVIETVIRRLTGRWAQWAPLPVVVVYVLVCAYQLDATSRVIDWSQATRETQYKRIAAELAASRSDCPLAALEIGALGYYYPGPILDLAGIVSPEAVGEKRGDVLRASSACWLVTYDENLLALDPTLFDEPWFSEQFTLRESLRINERRSLVVYARTGAH